MVIKVLEWSARSLLPLLPFFHFWVTERCTMSPKRSKDFMSKQLCWVLPEHTAHSGEDRQNGDKNRNSSSLTKDNAHAGP